MADSIFPEVCRNTIGYIAAESVYSNLYNPELHGIDHCFAHILVVVVQVGHILPIPGLWTDDRIGFLVASVPLGVSLKPGMIPCCVVGHPVEDDAHAVLVTDLSQILKIVDSTKLWSYCFIVADAVRGVLALLDADRIDWHDPHDVDTKVADRVDARCNSI